MLGFLVTITSLTIFFFSKFLCHSVRNQGKGCGSCHRKCWKMKSSPSAIAGFISSHRRSRKCCDCSVVFPFFLCITAITKHPQVMSFYISVFVLFGRADWRTDDSGERKLSFVVLMPFSTIFCNLQIVLQLVSNSLALKRNLSLSSTLYLR